MRKELSFLETSWQHFFFINFFNSFVCLFTTETVLQSRLNSAFDNMDLKLLLNINIDIHWSWMLVSSWLMHGEYLGVGEGET